MRLEVAAADAVIAYFDADSLDASAAEVHRLFRALRRQQPDWLRETVPSYRSLLIIYDVARCPFATVCTELQRCYAACVEVTESEAPGGQLVELPICYDGPDLDGVARATALTTGEVIRRHQAVDYTVYAIGFAPGFAYLGQLDPKLALPRLSSPRKKVAAGSLAIAERQTAIYPSDSPGGWHLIGRCPIRLFNPAVTPSMPIAIGDRVRFCAINRSEFAKLEG